MELIRKTLDAYYNSPKITDFIICCIVGFWSDKYANKIVSQIDTTILFNIYSYMISTSISLAGFLLAALTIIITIRSNLKAKQIHEVDNVLDLILATSNYLMVVSAFKNAIIEYISISITLFVVWALNSIITSEQHFSITITSILIISLVTIRSLYVLFSILSKDDKN